ncbi:hypothetical protein Tco_1014884 [Tanacetum coccineum]
MASMVADLVAAGCDDWVVGTGGWRWKRRLHGGCYGVGGDGRVRMVKASGGEDGVDGEMVAAIVGTWPENYSGGQNSPCRRRKL